MSRELRVFAKKHLSEIEKKEVCRKIKEYFSKNFYEEISPIIQTLKFWDIKALTFSSNWILFVESNNLYLELKGRGDNFQIINISKDIKRIYEDYSKAEDYQDNRYYFNAAKKWVRNFDKQTWKIAKISSFDKTFNSIYNFNVNENTFEFFFEQFINPEDERRFINNIPFNLYIKEYLKEDSKIKVSVETKRELDKGI